MHFKQFTLGPVDVRIEPGLIHCLVGANGSGKSTLIRATLGMQPSRGHVAWRGQDLRRRDPKLLARLGYVSDSPEDVIGELTAGEYWEFCAQAYCRFGGSPAAMVDAAHAAADALELTPPARRRICDFSLGMTRKVQIAAAVMHSPDVLVLDEPLIGLDYVCVRRLESLLREQRDRGAAIWMIGHDLGVVTRIADKVTALRSGQVVADVLTADCGGDAGLENLLITSLAPAPSGR